MKCPNKNTQLYKRLATQLSEDNLFRVWNAITSDEFDTWYGTRQRDTDGMPLVNSYLEVYNDKGQVGSLMKRTIQLKSTEDVEKLFSSKKTKGISKFGDTYYISKNSRQEGIKMVNIINSYYPGLLTSAPYQTTSKEIGVVDKSMPIMPLIINDTVFEQGRLFFSPSRDLKLDEGVGKMSYIINRLKEYSERVQNQIREAQRDKNNSKVEKLKLQKEELDKAIDELNLKQSVEAIVEVANSNLAYVERMLTRDNITSTELNEINDILSLYEYVDSTEKDKHPMGILEKEDLEKVAVIEIDDEGNEVEKTDYLDSTKQVKQTAQRAKELREDYNRLAKQMTTKAYNTRFSKDALEEDLFNNIKDISGATKLFRDAASMGNKLLSLLSTINNDSSRIARQETLQDQKEQKEMSEGLKKSKLYNRLGRNNFMELLWQKNSKGDKTGGMINRYTDNYWKFKRKTFNSMYESTSKAARKKAKESLFDSHEYVNYFEDEKGKEVELNRLTEEFGETRANQIIEEMDVEFAEYRDRKEEAFNEIDALEIDSNEKKYKKELWELRNNPQETIDNLAKGITKTDKFGNLIYSNFEFVRTIPRKTYKSSGEDTGFYDEAYERIEADNEALEYYNYVRGKIKQLLSYYPQSYLDSKGIHEGFIPVLKKNMLDQFRQDGMNSALHNMKDVVDDWYSIKTYSQTFNHLDPGTGRVRDSLNIRMLSPKYKYVEGGKIINTDDVVTDIDEILNQFIPVTNLYKHKSKVEGEHQMVVNAINQVQGIETTPTGVSKKAGSTGTEVERSDLRNVKDAVKFANEVFYETAERSKEKASAKKKFSKKEKETQDNLEKRQTEIREQLLDVSQLTEEQEEALTREQESIDRQLSDLGRNISSTKAVKSTLRYFQLISQGWNFSSASIELLYGLMSNKIHGTGNTDYNSKQISTGYRIAMGATMPGKTKTGKKFKALIEKLDVVGEVADVEKKRLNNSARKEMSLKNTVAPYEIMRKADMVSKGSVMVATMLNIEIKDNKGNVSNLWEAFDEEGNLKEEFQTEENINNWGSTTEVNDLLRLGTRIAQINKRNHGNYDPNSPIQANAGALGKSMLQFRRWMLEGFATRFENESFNENLDRLVKGRYRTYADLNNQLGTKATISVMFKALTYKMSFRNLSDEQLIEMGVTNETDLENVRKNASGLMWTMAVTMMLLMVKHALLGDDDKEKMTAFNFLLNQGGRLQQDLFFYSNPSTTADITKNIIPAFKLFDKIGSWYTAASNSLLDLDPEYHTEYQRGEFKGQSKLLIKSGELLPGTSTLIKTWRASSKLY